MQEAHKVHRYVEDILYHKEAQVQMEDNLTTKALITWLILICLTKILITCTLQILMVELGLHNIISECRRFQVRWGLCNCLNNQCRIHHLVLQLLLFQLKSVQQKETSLDNHIRTVKEVIHMLIISNNFCNKFRNSQVITLLGR